MPGLENLDLVDAYWRAANYLSVGQIYLLDNPLLREPLRARAHQAAAARSLGHDAGAELHLRPPQPRDRRARPERDLRHRARPRRPGPGRQRLPGGHLHRGLPAHRPRRAKGCGGCFASSRSRAASPATSRPRRRGRSTRAASSATASLHAYGAAFDNPDLLVACVIGDGEAETGPLAASWHSNKFLNPARDGAVLPILHLNGYKIANPTVLARIPKQELRSLLEGYGHEPIFVEGDEPADDARADGRRAAARRRSDQPRSSATPGQPAQHRPPALADDRAAHAEGVDRPQGGRRAAGRGHAFAPIRCRSLACARIPGTWRSWRRWLRSYRPEELFDERGALRAELAALPPRGRAADERQPARQRRPAAARSRAARLPRLRGRRARSRPPRPARPPACSAPCCAT